MWSQIINVPDRQIDRNYFEKVNKHKLKTQTLKQKINTDHYFVISLLTANALKFEFNPGSGEVSLGFWQIYKNNILSIIC